MTEAVARRELVALAAIAVMFFATGWVARTLVAPCDCAEVSS